MTSSSSVLQTVQPTGALDVERIRADFPILKLKINGKPLVYLDNAASSQMPQQVIDRLVRYQTGGARQYPPRRALRCRKRRRRPTKVRAARSSVSSMRRKSAKSFITRGTTNSLNLVMHGYGRAFIGDGDEIIVSQLEHHSNIVPWQMLCEEKGARLRVIPCNDAGELLLDDYAKLFNSQYQTCSHHPRLQCAGHDQSGQGDDRHRAPARRARAGRWRTGCAAHESGCAGSGLRFLRLFRATRCADRPASAFSTGRRPCWRK